MKDGSMFRDIFHFRMDSLRIKQVLLNVYTNALKFTNDGFIAIKVKTTQSEEGYHFLQMSVIDTGEGIPKEK